MRIDDRRNETIGRIVQYHQAPVGKRHWSEKAGLGIRNGFDGTRRHFIAEDVRDPRVVAAAIEVSPVVGKREALGHRLAKPKLAERLDVAIQHTLEVPYAEELITADFGDGP